MEGLLSRGDRRVGKVIRAVWEDGGRFDGWSEHFSYQRWMDARRGRRAGVDVDWYTTREREENEVLPWDHLDAGLDREWLWQDWQDAVNDAEVEDCRWTPVLRLRRLPHHGDRDPDRAHREEAAATDGCLRWAVREHRSIRNDDHDLGRTTPP